LPLEDDSVDRILCNPPFGKKIGTADEVAPLYRQALREMDRVLRPGGRAVLIASDTAALDEAARAVEWQRQRRVNLRILGHRASIMVYKSR
jgi:tRNA (guanine6-N2)-methyltransferase